MYIRDQRKVNYDRGFGGGFNQYDKRAEGTEQVRDSWSGVDLRNEEPRAKQAMSESQIAAFIAKMRSLQYGPRPEQKEVLTVVKEVIEENIEVVPPEEVGEVLDISGVCSVVFEKGSGFKLHSGDEVPTVIMEVIEPALISEPHEEEMWSHEIVGRAGELVGQNLITSEEEQVPFLDVFVGYNFMSEVAAPVFNEGPFVVGREKFYQQSLECMRSVMEEPPAIIYVYGSNVDKTGDISDDDQYSRIVHVPHDQFELVNAFALSSVCVDPDQTYEELVDDLYEDVSHGVGQNAGGWTFAVLHGEKALSAEYFLRATIPYDKGIVCLMQKDHFDSIPREYKHRFFYLAYPSTLGLVFSRPFVERYFKIALRDKSCEGGELVPGFLEDVDLWVSPYDRTTMVQWMVGRIKSQWCPSMKYSMDIYEPCRVPERYDRWKYVMNIMMSVYGKCDLYWGDSIIPLRTLLYGKDVFRSADVG